MGGSPYSKTRANMQAPHTAGVMPRLGRLPIARPMPRLGRCLLARPMPRLGRLPIARPMPRIDKSIRWARFLFTIHPIQMNHAHSNTNPFLIALPIADHPMSRQYQHSGLNVQGHQCHLNAKEKGRVFRPSPFHLSCPCS